jgi:hypothetical protein
MTLCLDDEVNDTVDANCLALLRTVSRKRPSSDPLII